MPDTTPCKRSSERRPKRQLEIEYGPEQPGSKLNQRDPERMSEEMPHRSSERLPESLHKMEKYVPRLGRGPRTGYPKTMRPKKLQGAVHSYPKPPKATLKLMMVSGARSGFGAGPCKTSIV